MIALSVDRIDVKRAMAHFKHNNNLSCLMVNSGVPGAKEKYIKEFEDLYSCKVISPNRNTSDWTRLEFEEEKYATMFRLRWA